MAWTDRYIDAAGDNSDGTTWAKAWTSLASMITGIGVVATPTRVYVKPSTYANTTDTNTLPTGATLTPFWLCGCDADGNAITADLSGTAGTNYPLFTYSSGQLRLGAYNIMSGVKVTASSGTFVVRIAARPGTIDNCWIESTYANSAGFALDIAEYARLTRCYVKADTAANKVLTANGITTMVDCSVVGGIDGAIFTSSHYLMRCLFKGQSQYSISTTTANSTVLNHCTFYGTENTANDGWHIATSAPLAASMVSHCLFHGYSDYAINNASGADTSNVHLYRNRYYACTAALAGVTEAFDVLSTATSGGTAPMVDAAGGNFTPQTGGAIYAQAQTFIGLAQVTYPDLGAIDHVDPAGSGAGAWAHRMIGGGF